MMGKKKKSKDGGCGAWFNDYVYALKGGNTQEFWHYDPEMDSWRELDTIPAVGTAGRKKRVKAGADIVVAGDMLYALKGNKTDEFWVYRPAEVVFAGSSRAERQGVQTATVDSRRSTVAISPNPLATGFARISYSLSQVGALGIRVYDVAGRAVAAQTTVAGRTGALELDLRALSSGVYVVRIESPGFTASGKLVVRR
jgi:hypothetical protein